MQAGYSQLRIYDCKQQACQKFMYVDFCLSSLVNKRVLFLQYTCVFLI